MGLWKRLVRSLKVGLCGLRTDMGWRCLFGHQWKEMQNHVQNHFEDSFSKRPWLIETVFLFQCEKCHDYKTKKLPGRWEFSDTDEDEGDDGESTPIPEMSPDDFYENLENN